MLDYILKSPLERKRLHITLIPREFTFASDRIAREGGFNIKIFQDWHNNVMQAKIMLNRQLTSFSIITSSLQQWF